MPLDDTCLNCGEKNQNAQSATCGKEECKAVRERLSYQRLMNRRRDERKCISCDSPNPGQRRECKTCRDIRYKERGTKAQRYSAKGLCPVCGKLNDTGRRTCSSCNSKERARWRRMNEAIKIEVMEAYGGPRCACCGETCMLMLSLDHINQRGAEDRRKDQKKRGCRFYRLLRDRGFPPGLRVLCYNCNVAVFRDPDHICPHRTGCFAKSA